MNCCNLKFAICNLQFAINFCIQAFILFSVLNSGNPIMAQTQMGRNPIASNEKTDQPQSRAGQGGADFEDRLNRELGPAAEKEADNPLLNIAQSMMQVRQRIVQTDAGPATLALQKQIVADLEQLIDQVRNSAGQNSSSAARADQMSRRQPNNATQAKSGKDENQQPGAKPASESATQTTNKSRSHKIDMQEMQGMMKELWGELPKRERQQVLQTPVEEFVPEYQDLIEDYYRDLAHEKEGIGDKK
jgi:hypothetical protein